jgi:hypothetical protein
MSFINRYNIVGAFLGAATIAGLVGSGYLSSTEADANGPNSQDLNTTSFTKSEFANVCIDEKSQKKPAIEIKDQEGFDVETAGKKQDIFKAPTFDCTN